MSISLQPVQPPTDPVPAADVDTLVDAGLMPEQPVPSADPLAPPAPPDPVAPDQTT